MKLKNFICGEDWAELNDFCFVFLHQGRQLKGKVLKQEQKGTLDAAPTKENKTRAC